MSLTKVTRNYQVTIPSGIRQALHIKIGSLIDFVMKKDCVVIKPKALIDEDQAWFWTKEWQKGERRADEEIKKGQGRRFKNLQEAKKYFEK